MTHAHIYIHTYTYTYTQNHEHTLIWKKKIDTFVVGISWIAALGIIDAKNISVFRQIFSKVSVEF